jgi:hypothetical protein
MRVLELFSIYTTNEESAILEKIAAEPTPIETYTDREKIVIENLIRKSLVTKIQHGNSFLVAKNGYSTTA